MAERKIDIETLVNKLDPHRLTRKQQEYVFGGRIVKKRRQTLPGKRYTWLD